jgi:hypothetical protein
VFQDIQRSDCVKEGLIPEIILTKIAFGYLYVRITTEEIQGSFCVFVNTPTHIFLPPNHVKKESFTATDV